MLEPVGSHNAGRSRAVTASLRPGGPEARPVVLRQDGQCAASDLCNWNVFTSVGWGNAAWPIVGSLRMQSPGRRLSTVPNGSEATSIPHAPPRCGAARSGEVAPWSAAGLAEPITTHSHPARPKLAGMGNPNNRASASPIRRGHRARPTMRWLAAAIAAATVVSTATACSDDDEAASGDDTATTSETTSTTQPPATDEASHEVVEELVIEATGLADELFQDPSVVDDPDSEALDELRELYTDDSPTPDGVEESVRGLAERGERYRPAASGIYREVAIYKWYPATDDDTLTFDTCSLIDREKVNAAGDVVTTEARVIFTGGEARRVDGVWRFYGLSSDVSRDMPIEPGQADPGFCQQVPDPEGGTS